MARWWTQRRFYGHQPVIGLSNPIEQKLAVFALKPFSIWLQNPIYSLILDLNWIISNLKESSKKLARSECNLENSSNRKNPLPLPQIKQLKRDWQSRDSSWERPERERERQLTSTWWLRRSGWSSPRRGSGRRSATLPGNSWRRRELRTRRPRGKASSGCRRSAFNRHQSNAGQWHWGSLQFHYHGILSIATLFATFYPVSCWFHLIELAVAHQSLSIISNCSSRSISHQWSKS